MKNQGEWREIFEGGTPHAEHEIFLALAKDMKAVQEANRLKAGATHPGRTLHNKMVFGVTNAALRFDSTMPSDFCIGPYQMGAVLPTIARFSNASGIARRDGLPDMRGVALRVSLPEGGVHDLLMTNFPVSHARNARQFVAFATIALGPRETMHARLVEAFGDAEARRMIDTVGRGIRPCQSFALETFWSRSAVLWGDVPVRFQLRPEVGATSAIIGETEELIDDLHAEIAHRLQLQPITFRLCLQCFIDEEQTSIEDGSADWDQTSPAVEVATLTIPQQDLLSDDGRRQAVEVDRLAFNPWNAPPSFRPLGNLNRARAFVYSASAAQWGGISPSRVSKASS